VSVTTRLAESIGAGASRAGSAVLRAVGTATPCVEQEQSALGAQMSRMWGLRGSRLERWDRIVRGTGIERRRAVRPIEGIVSLSTRERMAIYEEEAPALAEAAARRALAHSGVESERITDLIVVSCTGFSAPGVDAALVSRLGLSTGVRRTVVGFMGCFGAISGLRTAVGACCAAPGGAALVVCVELCSLHIRLEPDMDNQIASALFADGAAAAVVTGDAFEQSSETGAADRDDAPACAPIGRVTMGASELIPEGAAWMTWRITDAGFAMTLRRQVPSAIRERMRGFLLERYGIDAPADGSSLLVHPGGAGILDAVEEATGTRGRADLESARGVLRAHGNMSSGTVLFVLEEALRRGVSAEGVMLAFGPGLTVESVGVGRRD